MESKKQGGGQPFDTVKDTQEILLEKLQLFSPKELKRQIKKDNSDNGTSKLREKNIVAVSGIIARQNFLLVENGRFFVFRSTHWVEVDSGLILQFIGLAIEKMGLDGLSWKYHRFIQDVYSQLQIFAYQFPKQSETNIVRLNVLNGTVEINLHNGTVTLKEHDKVDGFKYVLSFKYEPKAKAPQFVEKALNENLPDKTKQAVLLEYIASIFLSNNHIKLEKVLFLYGGGRNGKSLIFEIVQALFGGENITNFSLENLTDNSGYSRALIANKLLNYCSDISKKINVENFKRLASKEPIEARLPYGEPHTITNYASLIFNTNSLPESTDFTNAFFRRFLIIHFDQTIPEDKIDRKLAQKIIDNELPGIFNLIIEALQRLLKQNDFTYSEPVEQALRQYRNESDEVRFWLNESKFIQSENDYSTLQYVYEAYQSWCIMNGYKLRQSNKSEFKNRLLGMGIVVMRKKIGWVVFLTEKSK